MSGLGDVEASGLNPLRDAVLLIFLALPDLAVAVMIRSGITLFGINLLAQGACCPLI